MVLSQIKSNCNAIQLFLLTSLRSSVCRRLLHPIHASRKGKARYPNPIRRPPPPERNFNSLYFWIPPTCAKWGVGHGDRLSPRGCVLNGSGRPRLTIISGVPVVNMRGNEGAHKFQERKKGFRLTPLLKSAGGRGRQFVKALGAERNKCSTFSPRSVTRGFRTKNEYPYFTKKASGKPIHA